MCPDIVPDLSAVAEVTPGEYTVRIVAAEPGQWEKEGRVTGYVKLTMEIVNHEKLAGHKIFDRVPYTGGGAFRMRNLVRAAKGEDLVSGQAFATENLIGAALGVIVDKSDMNPRWLDVKEYKTAPQF